MSYVYLKSEPNLWTVGHYGPDGKWVPESDHELREGAANRVAQLNGGPVSVGKATRVDIVTVRDPDYSNAYSVFVNGEDVTEGDYGAYVMGLPVENELRLEIWDIDLGRDDLSDPAVWKEWQYARADHDSDLTLAPAVRECIANVARQVAEKWGHEYPAPAPQE